ncbi:MAG TPA: TlpA disulfide reductase family protein [Allosphingosinicella sp.]
MRPVIACLLGPVAALALGACDRQNTSAEQGGGGSAPAAKAAANAAAPAGAQRYPTGRLDRSKAGTAAPDIQFEDPDGEPATFADFRGRPLLVNLWATWCAPCVVEMPSLDRLAVRRGERLQVLALSEGDDRRKVTDFFAARRFAALDPYRDADLAMMTALRIDTLPTTILYDAEGKEVWRMTGMAEWDGERALGLIAEAERR